MMHARMFMPGKPLRRHVVCLWHLFGAGRTPAARPERILPHGCVEIVLSFASAGACQERFAWTPLPARLVAGAVDRAAPVWHGDTTDSVGIRLHPAGAAALLGVPGAALASVLAPLDRVAPALDRALASWMDARAAGQADLHGLERVLLRHLARGRSPGDARQDALARRAVDAMLASGGAARVGAIADALGLSARHLDRRFRRAVGLPPRRFGRIVRFARAWQSLAAARPRRWAEMAAVLGYADQPHLIREFRDLAGTTPARLFPADWYERTTWAELARGRS